MARRFAVRITRQAISPLLAMRIFENIAPSAPLHPEHAEARLLDRRVEAGGQGEAEHHARLGGIDDAVIPEPRAGIVGMALRLVLRQERRLECGLLLSAPVLTPRLERVAPDGGEHRGGL